jgi:hypothetical protein
MKRSEIKRRPLADTTLSGLEPEAKPYREQDGASLYSRVKLNGGKSWELRYKKADGKWSWLGLGGYPEVSDSLARQKAAEEQADASEGKTPSPVSKPAKPKNKPLITPLSAWRVSGTPHVLITGMLPPLNG